ncbi:MAG: hypothetical protein ACYTEQ_01225 [Planctomycetota bacterium]|jgi:hypothetical protein
MTDEQEKMIKALEEISWPGWEFSDNPEKYSNDAGAVRIVHPMPPYEKRWMACPYYPIAVDDVGVGSDPIAALINLNHVRGGVS